MKISLDWLGDYIEWIENDPEEIGRRITASVAEVDEVEIQGRFLDHCCVGKVLTIEKHPDADKLMLCDVETDKGKKRVVCGGTNLREGMKVAFAHVGATVRWHGTDVMTLEPVKIRGEQSEGMICAAEELDLSEQFPASKERLIVDMGDAYEDDQDVGKSLKEHLGLTDIVLHIDNHAITHRADLFSHIGFARECVAMGLGKAKKDFMFPAPAFAKEPLPFKFKLEEKELMPRYLACTISIDGLGETPDWMKRRLEATGWRSLSLPIDITNYIMMETGLPMHSFDLDDLKGTVHMRKAKKGEKMTTLDRTERELSEGALLLEDDEGIFDLLGVMGGLRSSTKETTRNIYLHGCSIDPVTIRMAMINMGHRTDAGGVYEKRVPHIITEQGFYRAVELFLELVPGAKITSQVESYGDNGKGSPIELDTTATNQFLGTDIPEKKMVEILTGLGFEVEGKGTLKVTPPVWRLNDIEGSHDLMEEVGRVYGYDDIEPVLPDENITPPHREKRIHKMRDTFKDADFVELLPLSIMGKDLLTKAGFDPSESITIENPIGEEISLVQPSTLPKLLEHSEHAIRSCNPLLKSFTVSRVYRDGDEILELGMLVAQHTEAELKGDSFLHAKADLTEVLASAGYDLQVRKAKNVPAYAHAGRCADVVVDDTVVGQVFELHPSVREAFDLPNRASAALINLDALLALPSAITVFRTIPQYPAVTYDITMTLDQSNSAEQLVTKAGESSELLESVEIADLYTGKELKGGKYNLTLRCTYRSPERTLTEEEVKKEHDKVVQALSQ